MTCSLDSGNKLLLQYLRKAYTGCSLMIWIWGRMQIIKDVSIHVTHHSNGLVVVLAL